MTDEGNWLVRSQYNTQGKLLTQDAEMHCMSEILSWFSSTFAGVQAHLNAEMMEWDFTYIYIIFQSHSDKNLNNLLTLKKNTGISRLSCAQSKPGSLALGIKDLAVDTPWD